MTEGYEQTLRSPFNQNSVQWVDSEAATDLKELSYGPNQSGLGLSTGVSDTSFRNRCMSSNNQHSVPKINYEAFTLGNSQIMNTYPCHCDRYFMCAFY